MRLFARWVLSIGMLLLAPLAVRAQKASPLAAPSKATATTEHDKAMSQLTAESLTRDFRFAPSGATLLGAVRVSALLKSELLSAGLAEARKSDPKSAAMLGLALGVLGEIKELRFALVDKATDNGVEKSASHSDALSNAHSDKDVAQSAKTVAGSTASAALAQVDAVLLISGKLDDSLVAMLTQAQTGSLQAAAPTSQAGLSPKSAANKIAFRRVDAETILLGTEPLLSEAFQRMGARDVAGAPAKSALLTSRPLLQKAALQGDHDVWIAGRVPDVPVTAGVGGNLRGFALGFSLPAESAQDPGLFEVMLEATSAPLAESLLSMVRDAAAQQPQWAGLITTTLEDTSVHVVAKLPADRTREAVAAAMHLAPNTSAAAHDALPPPPPARKTIHIHGLSEGEIEIPLQ